MIQAWTVLICVAIHDSYHGKYSLTSSAWSWESMIADHHIQWYSQPNYTMLELSLWSYDVWLAGRPPTYNTQSRVLTLGKIPPLWTKSWDEWMFLSHLRGSIPSLIFLSNTQSAVNHNVLNQPWEGKTDMSTVLLWQMSENYAIAVTPIVSCNCVIASIM